MSMWKKRALECLSIVREEKIVKKKGSEKIGGSRQSIRNATKFTLEKEFPRNVFYWKKYYFYDHLESNFHKHFPFLQRHKSLAFGWCIFSFLTTVSILQNK